MDCRELFKTATGLTFSAFGEAHGISNWRIGQDLIRGYCNLTVADNRTKHPLYKVWSSMIDRCHKTHNPKYRRYGGRGIKIHLRWLHYKTGFWNFVEDMGPRPDLTHSLDRIDNDGDYGPDNCRWATAQQQALNRSIPTPTNTEVTGVYRRGRRYRATIRRNGRNITAGTFDTVTEAARHLAQLREELT